MSHSDSELNETRDPKRPVLCSSSAVLTLARTICRSNVTVSQLRKLQQRLRNTRQYLIKQRNDQLWKRRLLDAVSVNNLDTVRTQLQLGVSPNATDLEGRSALHLAVSKGYAEIVTLLLDFGADPNRVDKLCNTPLHLAACTNNLSIISLLLKAGADVTKIDLYGKNPLQLAKSKLNLMRNWRSKGTIEMVRVRSDLEHIIDIFISVLSQQKQNSPNIADLQLMKLSINERTENEVDDQIAKLLTNLQAFKI